MRCMSFRRRNGRRTVSGFYFSTRAWTRSRWPYRTGRSRRFKMENRTASRRRFLGGEDGECEPCQRGDFVNCTHPVVTGITADGGYAEVMIAEARALASIPDELTSAEAAPLLCAGITTFNALRNAGLRAGALVAIQGVGGLGHLGIQFARRMGFKTVALNRGNA